MNVSARPSFSFAIMRRSTRVHPLRPNGEDIVLNSYPNKSTYCVKYSMFFMNVLFWLTSCLLLAIATYAMLEKQEIYRKINRLATDPAAILLCIGLVIFIISFTGCLGALRENTCLLRFYSGMLGLMLLLEITAAIVGYVYAEKVKAELHKAFTSMIVSYRDDPDLQLLIDTVQRELKCCGSEKYTDWKINPYFNCSSPAIEACGVPFSCCITDEINSQCGFSALSFQESVASKSIYTQGCLKGVEHWFRSNLILMASVAASLPILQILGYCLAKRLIGDIKEILRAMLQG